MAQTGTYSVVGCSYKRLPLIIASSRRAASTLESAGLHVNRLGSELHSFSVALQPPPAGVQLVWAKSINTLISVTHRVSLSKAHAR